MSGVKTVWCKSGGVRSVWRKKFLASELPGVNKRCLVEKVSGVKCVWW